MKLAFFTTLVAASALAQQPMPIDVTGSQVKGTRVLALKLLQWPTAQLLSTNGVPAASTNVAAAIDQAQGWIRMVVDPQWLPERLDPVCVRDEFEKRDIVRYKWTSRNNSFLVAQTWSMFALEIKPEAASLGGESKDQQLDAVRKLCVQVFRKTGVRPDFQGNEIEVPEFNAKLINFSFSAETTQQITNGVVLLAGRPRTMEEEGVKQPETAADAQTEGGKWLKPGWEKTSTAWQFWFRNLYWFADRDRVVIFFVKAEAGPIFAAPDDRWFRK